MLKVFHLGFCDTSGKDSYLNVIAKSATEALDMIEERLGKDRLNTLQTISTNENVLLIPDLKEFEKVFCPKCSEDVTGLIRVKKN